MQLVEQHIIRQTDSRFVLIDAAAFAAKNLYNAANYRVRQSFIHAGVYLNYYELYRQMKETKQYQALPRKVSQQVLLDRNWKSFFAAIAAYRKDPSAFTGEPGIPKYLDKTKGRAALVYTIQAVSRSALAEQIIKPSGLAIKVTTKQTTIAQVRIVPRSRFYVVEVIYERDVVPAAVNPNLVAGVDIGLNNLAAIASNKPGFVPVLVNGRPLKHINQFYNKQKAQLQAKLGGTGSTHLMAHITTRRNRQITHYLHTYSRRIIALLVREGIGVIIIGKNAMLQYKAALVGIKVCIINESHTSKCSFLDMEPIQHHDQYRGRRTQRGMFRTADGRRINADVNGAYNIIRKALPNAFGNGIGGVVVHPVGIAPTN